MPRWDETLPGRPADGVGLPCGAASVREKRDGGASARPGGQRGGREGGERGTMGADARHDQAAMPSLLIEAVNMLFDHYGKPPIA